MKTSEQEISVDEEFAQHVQRGLAARNKRLDPKYFYDEQGSQLFEEICKQPEYYPARVEASILQELGDEIIDAAGGSKIALVEFGSGSSSKTRILIKKILERQEGLHYFPIDISLSMLLGASASLEDEFSGLKVMHVHSDYAAGIGQIEKAEGRKVILFLGSSIGNFDPDSAVAFLSNAAQRMEEGDVLLVGFDLRKDPKILSSAYNDAKGLTARFNKNILARINKELGGEFDLSSFYHRAVYNKRKYRIEMHLVSRREQTVRARHVGVFRFKRGESIHTENSYKFTVGQIEDLAEKAGLTLHKHFTDSNGWFDLALLAPIQRRI